MDTYTLGRTYTHTLYKTGGPVIGNDNYKEILKTKEKRINTTITYVMDHTWYSVM